MKNDYPEANARLAEVAKNWADGYRAKIKRFLLSVAS